MDRQQFCSFENRLKWSIVISVLGSCLFFSGLVIFFIMGGTIYSNEHPKELTYALSRCSVETTGFRVYQCRSRASSYTCYAPIWGVTYELNQTINTTIVGTNRFRSISSIQPKLDEYQIGSSYPCWYDTTNVFAVQWEEPDARVGVILLVCGGLSILPILLGFFLTVKFCKQIRRQTK